MEAVPFRTEAGVAEFGQRKQAGDADMVTVVSGTGLGLFGSSASMLGGGGMFGQAGSGRGPDRIYVNSATGNLIVQSQDEALSALGLDLQLIRTYNSQGLMTDDNGDNWRFGVQQRVLPPTGSTVTKVFGDGREVVYLYNVAQDRYVSTEGDTAHDTLQNVSGTWTWTDGTSRRTETYDSAGRLTHSRDADGNTAAYTYGTGGRLTQIVDSSGQTVSFEYTTTSSNDLAAIHVVSGGQTQTLTRYTYDGSGRLATVTVDLTPADNSVTDNVTYTTVYTYDGSSKRIASITQKDGSSIGFTYEFVNGQYRVKNYEEGYSPTPVAANTGVLTTTETQTTTNTYNLTGVATPPGWTPAALASPGSYVQYQRVSFNSNGDGVMAWYEEVPTQAMFARLYSRATGTWSAPIQLASGLTIPSSTVAIDNSGNVLVAWNFNNGTSTSIYARRYVAATQSWTGAEVVQAGTAGGELNVVLNNGKGAVSWVAPNVGSVNGSLYVATLDNGVWAAGQVVETSTDFIFNTALAMAANGSVMVQWNLLSGSVLFTNFRDASAGTWAGQVQHINLPRATTQFAFDGAGNGLLAYVKPGASNLKTMVVRRFSAATSSWEAEQTIVQYTSTNNRAAYMDVDVAGNAMLIWTDLVTLQSKSWRFDALTQTWGAPQTLGTFSDQTWMTLHVEGSRVALSARSSDNQLNVLRWENGSWGGAELLATDAFQVGTAMDTQGNITAAWMTNGSPPQVKYSQYRSTYTYPIPSGATWTSIAQTLYGVGSTAAGDALRTLLGNPSLTAGNVLRNLPQQLSVTTSVQVPVTPYYTVLAADTWSTITQAIYGSSSPGAVAALQAALGNPTLQTGAHLLVPLTLSISTGEKLTTFTNTAISGGTRTDVQNPLGFVTSYTQDAAGRLTIVQSPTVNGARLETRYAYDADGNVTSITEDPTGLNRVTTFGYDANGNVLSSRDNLGNTVTRTYNSANQLLTETQYVVRDPDGAGSGLPSSPLTTRYVYDTEHHLRFEISPTGRVTEHRYSSVAGSDGLRTLTLKYTGALYIATPSAESDLSTWAAAQTLTKLERAQYAYDFRGNLTTLTAYVTTDSAGLGTGTPSVTKFVYDQRGQLLQTIEARGSAGTPNPATPNLPYATTYIYDGLGRVLSTTQWTSTGVLSTTLQAYDDANRRTTTTLANGLITARNYNRTGELVSVVNGVAGALGTTTYGYDTAGRLRITTDPTGVRQFNIYDDAGRRVAQVDGDGSLTEFIYNRAGEVVKTVRYAVRIDGATLASMVDASGNPVNIAMSVLRTAAGGSPAADQISRHVYNVAGQCTYTIDEIGAVTQYFYDGAGRVTDEVRYVNAVTIARTVDEVLEGSFTITTNGNDRRTRNFYDSDGKLLGTLDGAGYLVEYKYDACGHLIQQIAYATRTPSAQWVTGTLDQLRPALDNETTVTPERDIVSYFFYDGEGQRIGVLDGESYLTESVYDVAGGVTQTKRWDRVLTYTAGTSTFQTLKTAATAAPAVTVHTTSYLYDGAGRVTQQTDYENTNTAYTYDAIGQVVATSRAAAASEVRTTETRYDFLGRVLQELTAQGRALITGGTTPAQIDDIWNRYGVTYAYDEAGRRKSATVRPDDTQTNVTFYYYDEDNRLRFEVNALGERKEYRYNALGQLTDEFAYINRISTSSLTGGLLTAAMLTTLTASASSTQDARITHSYTLAGRAFVTRVRTTGTASEDVTNTFTYNSFGESTRRVDQIAVTDGTKTLRTDYVYDKRGLLTSTAWDPTVLNISEGRAYDAFGRLTQLTDGRGNVSRYEYDRLGRSSATVSALGSRETSTYDAFSRVLTTSDALGNATAYQYNDTTRTMTVTTPESIVISTVHSRHGQTLSVTAAGNTTSYTYDLNGNLTGTSDTAGTIGGRTYDRAGRQITVTDALGTTTTLAYDAANRVLIRTLDQGGLARVTTYVYDGQGRVKDVTDPSGRLTRTTYDASGRVTQVAIDPSGLNLRTSYAYDRMGNTLTVVEGVGSTNPLTTQYQYDLLGRRIEQLVDPGTGTNPTTGRAYLNLRTQYRYDKNGNLSRTIDASGYSTWYVYDADNRLTHTIDALGGVALSTYDAENRVIGTRRLAQALPAATMTTLATRDVVTTADFSVTTSAADRFTQSVYDRDDRERYTVDSLSGVTERTFDANGNVTRERFYANPVAAATYASITALQNALTTAGNNITTPAAGDRVRWSAYDVRGRKVFEVDGSGAVVRSQYDAAGNVIATTAFATPRDTTLAMDAAALQSWATPTAIANHAANRSTRLWYDAAGRLRFDLDAEGYLTQTQYNDVARTQTKLVYVNKPTIPATVVLVDLINGSGGVVIPISVLDDQTTTTLFDAAGRLLRVTDAVGNYDEYTYDAVGNKLTWRNRKAAVWNYVYDANRRLLDERSPTVSITSVTVAGTTLTPQTETASIVTRMTYDALGNVLTRTEGVRRYANNTESSTGSRATTYQYDALGRQTLTQLPRVSVYSGAYDNAALSATTSLAQVDPISTVTYDALGNATRNVDIGGGTSYKVYDSLGRVRYDIDALGYVIEHVYNAFGNETSLTRFAQALSPLPAFSGNQITLTTMDGAVTPLRSNVDNRTLVRTFDRLNRVRSVAEPAAFSFEAAATPGVGQTFTVGEATYFDYNAFGQTIREWRLVNPLGAAVTDPATNPTANAWATTHRYFDRRGALVALVDPLRYVTKYLYDETGDLTRVKEFARALTSFDPASTTVPADPPGSAPNSGQPSTDVGYDRETQYSYDQVNRRKSELLLNVEYGFMNGVILEARVGTKSRSFQYDALGNQTVASDLSVLQNGASVSATTYTYYDVLGRVVAVAEPSRNPGDGTTLIPLAEMKRDALGNLVEEIRYSAGATAANVSSYTLATTSAALERHSLLLLDSHGRITQTQDPKGAIRQAAYNVRGDVVKEWQTVTNRALTDLGATPTTSVAETLVTLNEYDVLGHKTVTHELQVAGTTPTVVRSRATYNGFGEISQKSVDGSWTAEYFHYDKAGRLWRTNSGDGAVKVYLYDLADRVTAEVRSATTDLGAVADAFAANSASATMRTETRYDLLGHVIERRLPSFQITATQDLIDAQPQISVLPTPVPPNAVYRTFAINVVLDASWGSAGYIASPADWNNGGGYYQVSAPTAANPYGTYARVAQASYSLTQARQLFWQQPDGLDVTATFEYWPTSSPTSVSTIQVFSVSIGLIGVNIAALASGSYGYRISYTRTGAPSAFARQEGTFNPGTSVVTPTSAVTLQPQTVTPSTQQSFDRWGNVISVKDSGGNLTQYRYNQLNLLTHTLLPSTRVVRTGSGIDESVERAQFSNYYDLHGRLIEARDAYGASNRATYNSVGQVMTQQNADHYQQGAGGSTKRFVYDAYGNVLQVTDELGFRARNVYDKVDNLVTTVRESQLNVFALSSPSDISAINNALIVTDSYSYDEAGRRIAETNGELESIKYWYDLRGNLLRRRTPRNFDTTYDYDAFARKTRETDANQSFSTWTYDAFGRLTGHIELTDAGPLATYFQGGGTSHTYLYDSASQLTSDTTSLGVTRTFTYDTAGHALSLTETGTPGAGVPLTAVNRTTTFGYDAAGRKAHERIVVDGRTHQDTRTEYDELGRIASVDDPDYRVRYSYDANGNRTRIQASYLDHQLVSRSEDLYYRYDAMNRVIISQGYRTPGAVPDIDINSTQGIRITYDAKGQRTSARTLGKRFAANEYRTNGVYQYTLYAEITPTDGLATEYYGYDGLGRLATLGRETDLIIRETTTGNVIGGSWTSTVIGERTFDKASRQTQERTYNVEGTSLVMRQTATVYDDDGRATTQQTSKSGQLESVVQYGDTGTSGAALYQGYDTAGLLHGYKVDVYLNGAYRYTTTYQNSYRLADNYLEVGQSAASVGTGAPLAGSTTRSYDLNGHLVKFTDSKDVDRTRYFANNSDGQALTAIQGNFDGVSGRMTVAQAWDAALNRSIWAGQYNQPKAQHFFFTDGKYVGSFGQLQSSSGVFDANFDVNYTPISADYPASTPSQVIAQAGDTLRTIAARVFGDAALWYVIAEENGLSDPNAVLVEGTALQVPNDVISLANTSTTFKPFNVSEALGDTSPTQPAPPAPKPKKKGCGVLGTILIIVVAIVVTVFTAGVAAPGAAGSFASIMSTGAGALAGGSIGAAAIGGAVGSIASQGVAMALGMQQGFDWKGVALGAIGAGVTAGLGASGAFAGAVRTLSGGNAYAAAALNAAAGNSITQGVAVATGLQSSFSWRDVAISAVAAPVANFASAQAGRALSGAAVADFGQRVAGSVAGSVVRRQFGGKVDSATILADAFGNALGSSIVSSMLSEPSVQGPDAEDGIAREDIYGAGAAFQPAEATAAAPGPAIPTTEVLIQRELSLAFPETLDEIKITKSLSTSLGADVDDLINASPLLTEQINSLMEKGGHVYLDSGPTRSDASKNLVYLNPVVSGRSATSYVRSLAHELGHIAFGPGVTSVAEMTHSEYVRMAVNAGLASEGAATLNMLEIREQLLNAGKADINPLTGNSVKYQQIFEEFKATGDPWAAQVKIGEIFRDSEHPNDPLRPPAYASEDTYGQYYTQGAEKNWAEFAKDRREGIADLQGVIRKNQEGLRKTEEGVASLEKWIKQYKGSTFAPPDEWAKAERSLANYRTVARSYQDTLRDQQQRLEQWRRQLDSP
jgi:YD repeat-containing protein